MSHNRDTKLGKSLSACVCNRCQQNAVAQANTLHFYCKGFPNNSPLNAIMGMQMPKGTWIPKMKVA